MKKKVVRNEITRPRCQNVLVLVNSSENRLFHSKNILRNESYIHRTVNHSANFIDSKTGVHTQNIERLWRKLHYRILIQNSIQF